MSQNKMYKKGDGTSGIRGQLYETKLISLIHFRTKFDDSIEGYNLATNVADIGTFDDICIRAKVKINGEDKPVAVFIQAKHREGDNVQQTLNSKDDLAKWFSSYLSIKRLFKPGNEDVLFEGNFQKIECLFIMYTTAKADPSNTKEFESDFAEKLNSLIGTGDKGLQPCHKEEDIVFLCEIIMKEQFAALAVHLAKFLSDNAKGDDKDGDICQGKDNDHNDDPIMPMMNNDLLLLYHFILVQNVLDVSEIRIRKKIKKKKTKKCKNKENEKNEEEEEEEYRVATFKTDFFYNDDDFIILFKDTLFIEMLRNRKLEQQKLDSLLLKLFTKPLEISVLGSLIGNVVTFNDKKLKLEFVSKSMTDDLRRQLDKVHVLKSTVNEAITLTAKDMLIKRDFKVEAAFGNKDLTIRGKEDKIEPPVFITSVIDKLKTKIVDLIKASPAENIITIDETVGKEFLQPDGGLASTIGNILVSDENSKYMKFSDNGDLEDFAKRLYDEVQSAIPNLHDYKFHIKVKTFPKLTFDCDDDEDIKMLKDQVTVLAKHMGECICKDDNSIMKMKETVLLRFHVLVAQKAVEVSEILSLNEDDEHRLASFRQDFFESDGEFDILFKNALCYEILKIKNLDEKEINLAVKEILTSRSFKVPASFGNKDLTIKIKKSKVERRLDHLKSKISELITNAKPDKVITLDESLDDSKEKGLLKLNGGIPGIVGNILVSEENTKLMKFTNNWESLGELSKRLFMKLQNKIENLHEYKFDVKVKKFPKLSFRRNEDDEDVAKDFLKKLLFFTNQADEKGVENFLKDEIEDHQCGNVNNVRVTADAIFLQYHDFIQRWWMLKEAVYLTKQNEHYEEAIAAIVDKPLLSIITKMYMIKIKNNTDYTFNETALNYKLMDQPQATIFVTESSALTVAKMVQSLKKTDHNVFDLEYVLELPAKDYNTVCIELKETKQTNLIIIVCNNINRLWIKRLESIAKLLENKRTIFVLKETLVETIKTYFKADNIVTDEKCNLIQMNEKSQKIILDNTKVMFQDVEVRLNSIIDETSMALVEGEVLDKIMNDELIVLGTSNSNSNYEKLKRVYIDRHAIRPSETVQRSYKGVHFIDRSNTLITLNDIDNVALITAKPGMGKSTLLTHLSLKTKKLYHKIWIVRINLLIHSETFSKWQENKTNIDYLETLKFFCEVLTDKQNKTSDLSIELEEKNGDVTLKSCKGDQWTVFELKVFLDYYNRKELIFLFDGFDEICPMYTDEVLTLLKTVRKYPRTHKMCITSRSYDKIISTLEHEYGTSFEIPDFNNYQQNKYLLKFWKSKIILRDLSDKQYNNVCSFMDFMTVHDDTFAVKNQKDSVKRETHQVLFMNVCLNFLSYLREKINVCPESVVKTFNTLFSNCKREVIFMEDFDTPLHLYLIAEYFQNQIKDENIIPNRWNLDINAFTAYDTFIETKLKKIRFQEKNKIDLYNPDNMIIYENVRAEFYAKHHKLGAYAVFYQDAYKIFSEKELIEIKETIDKIKEGTEKTGLIHSVANGIPNFLHMTFTEYFAVQYICDLLRTETREDKQKSTWDFILNVVFKRRENVRTVLGYKIKNDEDLRAIVNDHKEMIMDLLLKQGKGVFAYNDDDFSKYLFLKIKTSMDEAMHDNLINFIPLMYNLNEKLTEDYLYDPTSRTPRIKRIKFHDLVHKKRKEFFLNSQDEGIAPGPVYTPRTNRPARSTGPKHRNRRRHRGRDEPPK